MSQTLEELQRRVSLANIKPNDVFRNIKTGLIDLLDEFTTLHEIPIALILNGRQEYLGPSTEMAQFCSRLWKDERLREQCLRDHQERSAQEQGLLAFKPCHAGLLNLSLRLQLGPLGEGALLAGQRPSSIDSKLQGAADARYDEFIERAQFLLREREVAELKCLRESLRSTNERYSKDSAESDRRYVVALGRVLEKYIPRRYEEELAKIVLDRGLARVLHEVANTSVYMELQARGLLGSLCTADLGEEAEGQLRNAGNLMLAMSLEARYECQNLLSAIDFEDAVASRTSEARTLNVMDIVRELYPAFQLLCENDDKKILFESSNKEVCNIDEVHFPSISGYPDLLRRALFNVFANALKYSYKTSVFKDRYISVIADPFYTHGPRRFAITFSNYGICFKDGSELTSALRFGFRGKDAVAERPVGSGIGLSEVARILRLHRGYVEIQSRPIGSKPALTRVSLVFNTE